LITREEFDYRVDKGEELVILDDLVLDISKYKFEHPAGAFLLKFNIGNDISKFFYGGYCLEGSQGMKPYNHSNVARIIVNTLVVGRINDEIDVFKGKITSQYDISFTTKVFTMRLEGCD